MIRRCNEKSFLYLIDGMYWIIVTNFVKYFRFYDELVVSPQEYVGGKALLIHDLPQQSRYNITLLKNNNIEINEVWTNRLQYVLQEVDVLDGAPKVSLYHSLFSLGFFDSSFFWII